MRDIRYLWEDYQIFDYAGVEKHLSDMAARGWRLEKTGAMFWKYRRMEPAKVTYAVTYIHNASDLNPQPTEEQQILDEYCQEAGWKKVADWFTMQIFSSEEADPIPIETDEATRLEVIRRCTGMQIWPINIALLLLFLLEAGMLLSNPITFFTRNSNVFLGLILLTGIILTAVTVGSYFLWSYRSEKSVKQGGKCVSCGQFYRYFNRGILVLTLLLASGWFMSLLADSGKGIFAYAVLYMVLVYLIIILMRLSAKLMKRLGFSKKTNQIVLIIGNILLCITLIGTLSYVFLHPDKNGESMIQKMVKNDTAEEDSAEKLPVTLQSLQSNVPSVQFSGLEALESMDVNDDKQIEHSLRTREYSTCFMWQLQVDELIKAEDEELEWITLSYDVLKVNLPFLYEKCRLEYMKNNSFTEERGAHYQKEDASSWNADRVYRWYYGEDRPADEWVICQGDYIVRLELSWEPSDGQKVWMMEQLCP